MTNRLLRLFLRSVLLLSAACSGLSQVPSSASAATNLPAIELERLEVKPLRGLTRADALAAGSNETRLACLVEVWSGMVEWDAADRFARVHLLLNRSSPALDVESHLPHEGKVVLRLKQTVRLVVRIPRWADKRRVECAVGSKPLRFSWLGNYLMLPEVQRGQSVVVTFPMMETTETVDLAWRLDQFWLESTQPPASWRGARPTRFTLTFRGNTLVDIHPRDTRAGYPLYATRSLESLRRPAAIKTVRRFVPAQP